MDESNSRAASEGLGHSDLETFTSRLAAAPYANRGVTIFWFEGEQIVEIQDYFDTERLSEAWPA